MAAILEITEKLKVYKYLLNFEKEFDIFFIIIILFIILSYINMNVIKYE